MLQQQLSEKYPPIQIKLSKYYLYHIVKHNIKAITKATIIDSLYFFLFIPSISLLKLGTFAEIDERPPLAPVKEPLCDDREDLVSNA